MKAKFVMAMAAAAMALAACSNDENEVTDNWNGEIRLSSGLTVQQTDTRAGTSIQGSGEFDNGESIDVFISEATKEGQDVTATYEPLTYKTGADKAMNLSEGEQPYFPASGNGVNIYAIYPEGYGTGQSFTVQANQSGDAGDDTYKKNDLMYASANSVARTSTPIALLFKHLLSKVTITLAAGNGLDESGLDGAVVTLQDVFPTIDFTPATGTIGTKLSGTKGPVTVMKASSSAAPSVLSGSAIVAPQTLAASFIQIELKSGGILTSHGLTNAVGGKVKLEGGHEYRYIITVNLTSLAVKVDEITGWDSTSGTGTADM